MAKISDVVSVTITRETKSVAQAGFGIPLILGPNGAFGVNKVRDYSDLEQVAVDYATTDDEYKAANALFAQTPRPEKIKIGVRATPVAHVQTLDFDADFVTGNNANILRPGELLRSIHLPASALRKRVAFRQQSLVKLGRSAALLIGTCGADGRDFRVTVTAATKRPVQFVFDVVPSRDDLRRTISTTLSFGDYFDDVNGSAEYKQHLTFYFAEQIRQELS